MCGLITQVATTKNKKESMSTNRKKTSDNDVKAVGFIEEFIYKENDRTALLESIQTEIKSMRNDVLEIRLKRDLSISRNEKIKLKAEANAPFDMYQRDINSFFEHIQSAVSDYLHYELMAKSRTTIGDSRKELQKISLKARELSHMLKTISPSSEKEIMMRGWISPENLPDQLDELIYVIDNNIISNIDKKKSLLKTIHPKRLLSRKVIDGLCELKVLPLFESTKDKVKIVGELMHHIIELSEQGDNNDEIEDDNNPNNLYRYINDELKNLSC